MTSTRPPACPQRTEFIQFWHLFINNHCWSFVTSPSFNKFSVSINFHGSLYSPFIRNYYWWMQPYLPRFKVSFFITKFYSLTRTSDSLWFQKKIFWEYQIFEKNFKISSETQPLAVRYDLRSRNNFRSLVTTAPDHLNMVPQKPNAALPTTCPRTKTFYQVRWMGYWINVVRERKL